MGLQVSGLHEERHAALHHPSRGDVGRRRGGCGADVYTSNRHVAIATASRRRGGRDGRPWQGAIVRSPGGSGLAWPSTSAILAGEGGPPWLRHPASCCVDIAETAPERLFSGFFALRHGISAKR